MPRQPDYDAPCCPYCCASLAKNGVVKGKQHWRCKHCHQFSETSNSVAHNSYVRTGFGVVHRSSLIRNNNYSAMAMSNDCKATRNTSSYQTTLTNCPCYESISIKGLAPKTDAKLIEPETST